VTTGKYYSEYLWTNGAANLGIGIANGAATLSNVVGTGINACCNNSNDRITVNGAMQSQNIGSISNGGITYIALDVGNQLIWFRNGATGNWNGDGSANPATGTGGISFRPIATGLVQ